MIDKNADTSTLYYKTTHMKKLTFLTLMVSLLGMSRCAHAQVVYRYVQYPQRVIVRPMYNTSWAPVVYNDSWGYQQYQQQVPRTYVNYDSWGQPYPLQYDAWGTGRYYGGGAALNTISWQLQRWMENLRWRSLQRRRCWR